MWHGAEVIAIWSAFKTT